MPQLKCFVLIGYRLDSIQGTDYIANDLFLNLKALGQKLKI